MKALQLLKKLEESLRYVNDNADVFLVLPGETGSHEVRELEEVSSSTGWHTLYLISRRLEEGEDKQLLSPINALFLELDEMDIEDADGDFGHDGFSGHYAEEEGYPFEMMVFADPGGRSALRAETEANPRIHPCPTCGQPNRLTVEDVRRGYQCDSCADLAEQGYP